MALRMTPEEYFQYARGSDNKEIEVNKQAKKEEKQPQQIYVVRMTEIERKLDYIIFGLAIIVLLLTIMTISTCVGGRR